MTARTLFAATLSAALTLVAITAAAPAAFAQDKMGTADQGKMGKMGKMNKMSDGKMGKMSDGKMDKMSKSPVYVSKMTKMYYAEPDAKQMKMMDTKGNKLVKMEKAPAGFKMGRMASGKMAPKMGKM